jgi:pimeloyl-ACP methyl ester carboxylesterase
MIGIIRGLYNLIFSRQRAGPLPVLLMLFFCCLSRAQADVTAPLQPTSGPGSSNYSHASVTQHVYGEGALEYWLFEPASPKPQSAPVVIFSHGWTAMNPAPYGAWINHLVRRGNIVIYPRYQARLLSPMSGFCYDAIRSVKNALLELETGNNHVHPQLDKVAAVGHSAGGQITAGIAASASAQGLPMIKAVMCVQPGPGREARRIPLTDVKKLPASTLLLTVAGNEDTVVKDTDARRIINESVLVPPENKNLVIFASDYHGQPPLVANHLMPVAPSEIRSEMDAKARSVSSQHKANAMNFYGTWKLFDALENAAFYGKEREFCLGNTPQQRYMGKWSDGVPVKEPVVEIGNR